MEEVTYAQAQKMKAVLLGKSMLESGRPLPFVKKITKLTWRQMQECGLMVVVPANKNRPATMHSNVDQIKQENQNGKKNETRAQFIERRRTEKRARSS